MLTMVDRRKRFLLVAVLAALTLATTGASQAQKKPPGRGGSTNGPDSLCNRNGTECVVGGKTTLTLSSAFKKYLARTKTRLTVRGGATRNGDRITFPVSKNGAAGPTGNPRSYVYQQGFTDDAGACSERTVNVASIHHSGVLELSQRIFVRITGRSQRIRMTFSKPWLVLDGSGDPFGDLGRPYPDDEYPSTASPLGSKNFKIQVRLRVHMVLAHQLNSYFRRPGNIPLGTARTTATVVPKTVCDK